MAATLHIQIVRVTSDPAHAFVPALQNDGFFVHTARDVIEGRKLACKHGCVLILLELDTDAIRDAIGYLRPRTQAPLLLLTARVRLADVLAAVVMGVDAYLVKPFALADLLMQVRKLAAPARARIRTRLLHPQAQQVRATQLLRLDDLVLNLRSGHCARNDVKLDLTRMEFALLAAFLRQQGCVLTYEYLLAQVWQRCAERSTNVVKAIICRLRRKLDHPFDVPLLYTVHGQGYVLKRYVDD